MRYDLVIERHADGSLHLVGEAVDRIHVSQELLDVADPAAMKVDDQGGLTFVLANATLSYRRVGLVNGDPRVVEFERVA